MARNTQNTDYKALAGVYSEKWYDEMIATSLQSAEIFVDYLWRYIQPKSVLDVGCGRGAWLKAWKEKGAKRVFGYDGYWNNQGNIIDGGIEFSEVDLTMPFSMATKMDLCMTLEVAEHLPPSSAEPFVRSLTDASDMVLFGAAFSGQLGTNHLNCQPHSYWAKLFAECGYAPFDIVRPALWSDPRVCFWYRANTFLYVKQSSEAYNNLLAQDLKPLLNTGFMDCVHPELCDLNIAINRNFKEHLRDLIPSFMRALRARI